MPRLPCLAILLVTTACQAVAPALQPATPAPAPDPAVTWSGISDNSAQCPAISFELVQKERMLEGWASGAGGERLLSEVRGVVEGTDIRLAVDRTVWTGRHGGYGITLHEPSGCQRTVVLAREVTGG
jgi:hypothetical protein